MFNCTKCGACCRRAFMVRGFPLPVNPDGSCSKLVDNQCSVYESRPDVCRHGHSLAATGLSGEDYDRLAARACNRLQEADGMPKHFRVKTD